MEYVSIKRQTLQKLLDTEPKSFSILQKIDAL